MLFRSNIWLNSILFHQVLNIAAVSIAEAIESQTHGKERTEDKSIFLLVILLVTLQIFDKWGI